MILGRDITSIYANCFHAIFSHYTLEILLKYFFHLADEPIIIFQIWVSYFISHTVNILDLLNCSVFVRIQLCCYNNKLNTILNCMTWVFLGEKNVILKTDPHTQILTFNTMTIKNIPVWYLLVCFTLHLKMKLI